MAASRASMCWRWSLDPAMGERGQGLGIALAVGLQPTGLTCGDQSLDHPPAAQPDDVADHPIELDVGVLQRLLQPLDMAAAFASKLLAGAQQGTQLLRLRVRNKAAADQ